MAKEWFDREAIKDSFGRAAAQYDRHAQLQKLVRGECLDMVQGCWSGQASILDLGCGTGALAREAAEKSLGWELTGADISLGMCRVAHQFMPRVANAAAGALPFRDESFDGVFSSLMIQWVDHPLAAFREMARVTRSGGTCMLSTFTADTLKELREALSHIDNTPRITPFMEMMQLSAFAAHAGFMLLAVEEETITEHYSDALSLMRSLKAIGATNKLKARHKGLMTRKQLQSIEKHYRQLFGSKEGLPATWQVAYLMLGKR
jgi:malonyl-CoA O-methyltransferase